MIAQLGFKEVFLIIDALDGLDLASRSHLLDDLVNIMKDPQRCTVFKVLITSRPKDGIRQKLQNHLYIRMTMETMTGEIAAWVKEQLQDINKRHNLAISEETQQELQRKLVNRAEGTCHHVLLYIAPYG